MVAFGPEVLRIVEGCTKPTIDGPADSLAAKGAYVARLAGADASILLVSGAETLAYYTPS